MRMTWRRTTAVGGLILGVTALAVSLEALQGGTKAAIQPTAVSAKGGNPFIVHEWGTFTNFAGADGVQLEFRPTVDHELPGFVFNRARQGLSPFIKSEVRAPLRMETPVTYFYTDRPRDVDVKVRFPQGLLTEFYPPVASMEPPYFGDQPAPLKDSFLDWGRVHLMPEADFSRKQVPGDNGKLRPAELPAVTGDDHYGLARQTDSDIVESSDQFCTPHFEKFLFYRGLGNFKLPLTLEALAGGRFSLTNFGADPIPALFLVHIENGRVRFLQATQLAAHGALYLEEFPSASTIEALAGEMQRALIEAGLYEKEARAMVNTWQSGWFGEDGTRLLYLVPERLTNALLPLSITPTPDKMVRVLVGRIEIMTPEREDQLETTIREMGTCLTAGCGPVHSELQKLGRFAEPALERIVRQASDESLHGSVLSLLSELRRGEKQ